ncbi:hypothetical protein FPSE_12403 [Fusarium pseudograminearum CS3096]|uniref:Uncharacterized protein n=1 Tax=Fusarium pseudograminearum (strain CS3096) TaxID=1028729 RepID=K3V6S9_FUSPC|nr:hypothetical protein FPSE_12403 [Fusarium pseudograminearum CS3096]EKJ67418.1 hypothetical protein FPSE_12403 [Fusarium pseudograminearum CS3096]
MRSVVTADAEIGAGNWIMNQLVAIDVPLWELNQKLALPYPNHGNPHDSLDNGLTALWTQSAENVMQIHAKVEPCFQYTIIYNKKIDQSQVEKRFTALCKEDVR